MSRSTAVALGDNDSSAPTPKTRVSDNDSSAPTPKAQATDGRIPGRRGQRTRRRLLDATVELLSTTRWRSVKVIDIARQAGTSPATFYQYFENLEQAIVVLAEEIVAGAGEVADLARGDWSTAGSWETAQAVTEGFLSYWEANRSVFRVVDLATEEGDAALRGVRVRALNSVTVALAKAIADGLSDRQPDGSDRPDPMAFAGALVAMHASVAAHRNGFELWGMRTAAVVDAQARLLHWAVTGRSAPPAEPQSG